MEQFSLDKWLQDKSRKVVTRDGRKVNILKYDAITPMYPVIVSIIREDGVEVPATYTKEGHDNVDCLMHNEKNDLFFADKEEELTEFEKDVEDLMDTCCNEIGETTVTDDWVRERAARLLVLARKEIKNNDWRQSLKSYKNAYEQGKQDALKDLPKWKKGTPPSATTLYVIRKGYYMTFKEVDELFEILPKEE